MQPRVMLVAGPMLQRRVPAMTARDEVPIAVIVRAQSGERDAQTVVLRRYAAVLHQLVWRLGAGDDAEAMTQAVLERVLTALPKFNPEGSASLTTWVFTVAHHFVVDQLRKPSLSLVPVEAAGLVVDEQVDPHRAAWRGQLRDALEVAIAQLPDDQRRVFVLVHVHEHPLEAVAEAERVPLGTVKSRLFRAKARLAHALSSQFNPRGEP